MALATYYLLNILLQFCYSIQFFLFSVQRRLFIATSVIITTAAAAADVVVVVFFLLYILFVWRIHFNQLGRFYPQHSNRNRRKLWRLAKSIVYCLGNARVTKSNNHYIRHDCHSCGVALSLPLPLSLYVQFSVQIIILAQSELTLQILCFAISLSELFCVCEYTPPI